MSLVDEVLTLRPGSETLDKLRAAALCNDAAALTTYVYYCAWSGIVADAFIPIDMKKRVFEALVAADMFHVELLPPAAVPRG